MARSGSSKTVYAALIGNVLIAATKFAAAVLSGSSAMLSEAVHSLVDTVNELLLLYGMRRAAQPADLARPLGYGRELYFWSFIVALLIFALGAGVSFYEGVAHILTPEPVRDYVVTYAVLALSVVFEGGSWLVAFRELRASKGSLGYFAAMRASKDPTAFAVLLEDSAALIGLAIAFAGIFAAQQLAMPQLDGVASIGISLVLAAAAVFLARETKGLLIGEAASPQTQADILRIAGADTAVAKANGVITVHMGPDQVVVALSAEFQDALTAPEIERCVERIEQAIKAAHPEITTLFVKPQPTQSWRDRRSRLGAEEAARD